MNIENDPEFKAWVANVHENLIPKLKGSAVTISIVPTGETDVKFAVELGLSIMMDKPIVLMVAPGTKIPAKLAKVADAIVEADWTDPNLDVVGRIGDAIDGLGL